MDKVAAARLLRAATPRGDWRLVAAVLDHALAEPRYRRIRRSTRSFARIEAIPGAVELLLLAGFTPETPDAPNGPHFVAEEESLPSLALVLGALEGEDGAELAAARSLTTAKAADDTPFWQCQVLNAASHPLSFNRNHLFIVRCLGLYIS